MSISPYLRELRQQVGSRLLLVPSVAALIRDSQGRLLLQRRAEGGWSLPAGAIDPGETPACAVVREVREETGLRVRPLRVAGVFGGEDYRARYANGDEAEFSVVVFECEATGGTLHADGEETAALEWFALAERPRLVIEFPLDEMMSRSDTVFER
jgi:8-oxo-dGTP pyrophosphatase MutT (NUDIX family)